MLSPQFRAALTTELRCTSLPRSGLTRMDRHSMILALRARDRATLMLLSKAAFRKPDAPFPDIDRLDPLRANLTNALRLQCVHPAQWKSRQLDDSLTSASSLSIPLLRCSLVSLQGGRSHANSLRQVIDNLSSLSSKPQPMRASMSPYGFG